MTALNIQTVTGQILSGQDLQAEEQVPFRIQQNTDQILPAVISPTYGTFAIRGAIQDVLDNLTGQLDAIQLQITHLTDGTTPVSLPSPPSGYGGLTDSATADAVWNAYRLAYSSPSMGDALNHTYNAVFNTSRRTAIRPTFNSNVYLTGPYESLEGHTATDYPMFDYANIHSDDTLASFLAREDPDHDWREDSAFPGFMWAPSDTDSQWSWIITVPVALWNSQVKAVILAAVGSSAPIWPGLDFVTLGDPVSISPEFTVAGPMDGIIVELDSVPLRLGAFTFDTMTSYRNLGGFAFVSDNGQAERSQVLAFTESVYVPIALVQAASCVFRTTGGVTGTVTPWLRSG